MSDPFYNSSAWKKVRRLKLMLNPLCEYHGAGFTVPATEVDHVVAIEKGGASLDLANLASCCRACHASKTRTMDNARQGGNAKRRRIKGCDALGRPLDPEHSWRKNK